jgi:hypothetical protein
MVIEVLVLFQVPCFEMRRPNKGFKIRTNIDIYRSNQPGTPLAVVEEKPSTIFFLMQQAKDE